MKANYHTHTARCGHAEGSDEAYVLAAIEQGFEELGFSDHVPWPYQSGFLNLGVRMDVRRLDEYLRSVLHDIDMRTGRISHEGWLGGFPPQHTNPAAAGTQRS